MTTKVKLTMAMIMTTLMIIISTGCSRNDKLFLQDDELEPGITTGEKHAEGTESSAAPKVLSNYIWLGDDNTNDNIDNGFGTDHDNDDIYNDDDDHDDDFFAGWKVRTGVPERQSTPRRERVRHVVHGKLNHDFLYESNIDTDDNGNNGNGVDNGNRWRLWWKWRWLWRWWWQH